MMMMMMAVCISSTKKKKSFFVHEEFVFSQKTVQLSAPLFKFCSVDTNRQDLARFEKKKQSTGFILVILKKLIYYID